MREFSNVLAKVVDTWQWRIQDFPEEGAPTPQGGGGRQHTILPKFPKNCMKLKEFGPPGRGARPKFYYVDPPLHGVGVGGLGRVVKGVIPLGPTKIRPPQKTATKPLCRFSGSATEIPHNQRYHEKNNFKSKN